MYNITKYESINKQKVNADFFENTVRYFYASVGTFDFVVGVSLQLTSSQNDSENLPILLRYF